MEELLRRFAQEFVDADGWIRILNAGWIEDTLDLELEILFYPDAELETWHLSCSGVVKASVSFEGTEILGLALESPLLKPYTEPEVDLMFSENECTPAFLLGGGLLQLRRAFWHSRLRIGLHEPKGDY